MESKEYIQLALVTESNDFKAIRERLSSPSLQKDLIESLAKMDEVTKKLDLLKKQIFYGKLPPGHVSETDKTAELVFDSSTIDDKTIRLLHATIGVASESGEIVEALSKGLKAGKLDEVNFAEEVGDIFWYLAIASSALQVTFSTIWKINIKKLAKRFGGKFSEFFAQNRQLEKEREILEEIQNSK